MYELVVYFFEEVRFDGNAWDEDACEAWVAWVSRWDAWLFANNNNNKYKKKKK